MLAFAAFFALLTGCGSDAPASKDADDAPASQASSATAEVVAADMVEVGYEVGMRAPDFSMSLFGGDEVTSASLAAEGKPTFLYFHAAH